MNRSPNIRIGKKFGELTILSIEGFHTEPSGHKRRLVKVRCSCGSTYDTPFMYLARKTGTRSCRKCCQQYKRICNIGEKYDKLTVVKYEKNKNNKRSSVLCKCDCGNKKLVRIRAEVLKNNLTNNCGCAPRGGWSGVGKISTTDFYHIRYGAERRDISFLISIEEAWELYEKQNGCCALTGLPIDFSLKTAGQNTASLDRINSKKAYTINNVQWIHKDVNKMKMDFEENYFKNLCRLITERNHGKL